MGSPLPITALIALLGLAIGSFLNVVIYRVPRHESVVRPGSHCPSCGTALKPWHNVPVFSWLALHGKCAFCDATISARYPLVEAGTAVLFAAMTLRFGLHLELPAYLFLVMVGLTLSMIDIDRQQLPNLIVLPSYVIAISLLMPAGAVYGDWFSAARALAGMVALAAIYLALAAAYPNGLDAGDVKVAGLVGLYLGWLSWAAVFVGAVGGLVIGGLTGMVLSATRAGARVDAAVDVRGHEDAAGEPVRGSSSGAAMLAFAPCLLAAAVLTMFVSVPLGSWYSSLLGAA